MGRSYIVAPEKVRLKLSTNDDDYVVVKKTLTSKEARGIFAMMVDRGSATFGEKLPLDPEQVGRSKVIAYLLDWGGPGFEDGEGLAVTYSPEALDDLIALEMYNAISTAVDEHVAAQEAAAAALKNGRGGASSSSAISPSAV